MNSKKSKVNTVAQQEAKPTGLVSMWAVMKVYPWKDLKVTGPFPIELNMPEDGPSKFIPVFDTKAKAVAFNDDCEDDITEVRTKARV